MKDNKVVVVMRNSCDEKNNDEAAKNLAISLSKTQCKILFINRSCKVVQKGVKEVLEGKESLDNIISKENDYLYTVELGNIINSNINLLDSQQMDSLVEELKLKYDYLIIDSESLDSSLESQILVAKADSVVLTAKINKTKVNNLEKLIVAIKYLNTNVISIILK